MTLQRVAEELFYAFQRQQKKTFLIASAFNGEGALPVAKQLAQTLAQAHGLKVRYLETQEEAAPPADLTIIGGDGLLENAALLRYLEYVEGGLLVVKAMVTDRQYIQEAIDLLVRHDVSLLGTILNYGERPIPPFLRYLTH